MDNDRIRLADKIRLLSAIGYQPTSDGGWDGGVRKRRADGTWYGEITHVSQFRPDTDANDDYACLQHAIKHIDPDKYLAALTAVVGSYAYLHEYRIGYFARAALQVIDV